jgi:signal peptidase II
MKRFWIFLAAIIFLADNAAKKIVAQTMTLGESFELIPGVVGIRYVHNTGVSFSFLSGSPVAMTFVNVIAAVVCAGIVVLIVRGKIKSKLFNAGLSCVLAGALGNLMERIDKGFVIDMIEPLFVNFAIFNVADVSLTVGVVLIVAWLIAGSGTVRRVSGQTE